MSPNNLIEEDIFRWLEKYNNQAEDPLKYNFIPKLLNETLGVNYSKIKNILIVGGNTCNSEQKILSDLKLKNLNLTSYDLIKPNIEISESIKNIDWICEKVTNKTHFENKRYDTLICLATSRYFDDTSKVYENIIKKMKIKSLLIIDFYDLPPLRREVTKSMYNWLINQWSINPKNTIKKLTTLSKISKKISINLLNKRTLITDDIPELGIIKGEKNLQSLIYESLFPFWFKEGSSLEEIRAILAYQFLSKSIDFNEDKINKFCQKNNLKKLNLFKFTNDTNLLVALKI